MSPTASTLQPLNHPADPFEQYPTSAPPANPRKRRSSGPLGPNAIALATAASSAAYTDPQAAASQSTTVESPLQPPAKKGRTNTPWTPAEEQRLKTMRDAGNSWSEIAKVRSTFGWLLPGSSTQDRRNKTDGLDGLQ